MREAITHKNPFLRVLASLILLLLSSSCVTGGEAVQKDINSVKLSAFQNRKEIAQLRKEIQALKSRTSGKLTNDAVIDAMRTSQTSLYTQVSGMTADVQSVNARLDEIQHESSKVAETLGAEMDLLKSKVERSTSERQRLKKIAARLSALEGALAIVRTQVAALSSTVAASASTDENTPDKMYKEAYAEYEQRKFTEARELMEAFIAKYPRHELTGNARFWIGETHFQQKRFDTAILAYQDVIEKHPENRKVPAAHLKQAYAFIAIGEKVAARGILKTIIKNYPKSDVAKAASGKLKEIK